MGNSTVTLNKLEVFPPCKIQNSLQEDKRSATITGMKHITTFSNQKVPKPLKMITSHVVYKEKIDEDGTQITKSRIYPHGKKYVDINIIYQESAKSQPWFNTNNIIHRNISTYDAWRSEIQRFLHEKWRH